MYMSFAQIIIIYNNEKSKHINLRKVWASLLYGIHNRMFFFILITYNILYWSLTFRLLFPSERAVFFHSEHVEQRFLRISDNQETCEIWFSKIAVHLRIRGTRAAPFTTDYQLHKKAWNCIIVISTLTAIATIEWDETPVTKAPDKRVLQTPNICHSVTADI